MKRALQLAKNGEGRVSPNPMVGAVIVYKDRIIGEGFHAYYGGPHAEVNAIRSIKDKDLPLLNDATIYVTLEPCAHHGKTPPCAKLIVDTGIPNVVIGTLDPNPLVAGKGVKILEDAGVNVTQGVLEEECKDINHRFMKAQTSPVPHVILKWAQSSDGYMAAVGKDGCPRPVKFSVPLSSVWMHRERVRVDAIIVGGNTERIDSPKLTAREWGGNSPKKIVAHHTIQIEDLLKELRSEGLSSVMVEGGPTLLKSFIERGIYDEIRIEYSPVLLNEGLPAPGVPEDVYISSRESCGPNIIICYRRKHLKCQDVKKA